MLEESREIIRRVLQEEDAMPVRFNAQKYRNSRRKEWLVDTQL